MKSERSDTGKNDWANKKDENDRRDNEIIVRIY